MDGVLKFCAEKLLMVALKNPLLKISTLSVLGLSITCLIEADKTYSEGSLTNYFSAPRPGSS